MSENGSHEQEVALRSAQLALMYICRPNCHMLAQKSKGYGKRWDRHIRFIDKLFENLRNAGMDEDGELYAIIVGRVCAACHLGPEQRCELLHPILDAIDYLLEQCGGMRKSEGADDD